jgi:phage/plasmid primase-like uncharacterized protein
VTARIDADQVRLELGVERVMDTFGLAGTKKHGWYRLRTCPRCGEKSTREAIAIEAASGRWLHHGRERSAGGECSGDLLDLVAACEGLDSRRDFTRILERCAEVAGIATASNGHDPDLEARVSKRLAERQVEEQHELARKQNAARDAAMYWDALGNYHDIGEVYLTRRGLDPYPLIKAGAVRFSAAGDICVAIRARSGRVTSVATRFVVPGERPKVVVRTGTSTLGTMVGSVDQIEHGRDVVIVEGVMDALTAREAWPTAIVLGANGAGNLAKVARAAIARVVLALGRLVLVPHDDEPGIRAMRAAGEVALGAGLELGKRLLVQALPAADLNAAWCAGWRPGVSA